MFNGIGSSTSSYALKDLINLAKYATGVPLTEDDKKLTVSQVVSYPAMLCGYEGLGWLKNNFGKYKQSFADVAKHGKEANQTLKTYGVSGVLRVSDAKEILAGIPSAEKLKNLSAATQDLYKQSQQFAQIAKSNPADKNALKKATEFFAKADASSYAEITKNSNGMFSKVKNALGLTKLGEVSRNLATKSTVFKKCKDAYDNEAGSFMLAMQGGLELFTNVVPTFKQLGAKRGFKQLGRSIGNVFSSVAGWIAGSAVGSKLGQVVGAAVGNTKVGAIVSAVAGKVGSYALGTVGEHVASRVSSKILGKSELEKSKEEEAVKIAQLAQEDPEVFDALVEQAAVRLAVEGEDTAESIAVNSTLRNLVAQKSSMENQNSQMMTKEELKAYADKLNVKTATNPLKSNYQGYIPSSAPSEAVLKASMAKANVQLQPQNQPVKKEDMTPEMKAILNKADRVIKNASRYLEK